MLLWQPKLVNEIRGALSMWSPGTDGTDSRTAAENFHSIALLARRSPKRDCAPPARGECQRL